MAVADFREKLLEGLGGEWPEPCPLNVRLRKTIPQQGFRIESVYYDSEPGDPIPAFLLIPDTVSAKKPAAAVAVWHQHNGAFQLGKTETAGQGGNPMHHTGAALAREGYVVLCPDALGSSWRLLACPQRKPRDTEHRRACAQTTPPGNRVHPKTFATV